MVTPVLSLQSDSSHWLFLISSFQLNFPQLPASWPFYPPLTSTFLFSGFRKNNLAAKKSRDSRRIRENQMRLRERFRIFQHCTSNLISTLAFFLHNLSEKIVLFWILSRVLCLENANQMLKEELERKDNDILRLRWVIRGYAVQVPSVAQYRCRYLPWWQWQWWIPLLSVVQCWDLGFTKYRWWNVYLL